MSCRWVSRSVRLLREGGHVEGDTFLNDLLKHVAERPKGVGRALGIDHICLACANFRACEDDQVSIGLPDNLGDLDGLAGAIVIEDVLRHVLCVVQDDLVVVRGSQVLARSGQGNGRLESGAGSPGVALHSGAQRARGATRAARRLASSFGIIAIVVATRPKRAAWVGAGLVANPARRSRHRRTIRAAGPPGIAYRASAGRRLGRGGADAGRKTCSG